MIYEYELACSGKANGSVLETKKNFVDGYNLGESGTFPAIYSTVGKTSFKTIERWALALRRNDNEIFTLADHRGKHRKGKISITDEQAEIIRTFAYHENRLLDSEIIRSSISRFAHNGIEYSGSDDTIRRFIQRLRTEDYKEWVFNREGWKSLNEKCLYHISRDYEAIDVGDIAFVDGHTLNFECLNPWTGKPKRMCLVMFYDAKSNYPLGWEISPSENTDAVKMALYRSILALGKIPIVVYLDNGRAFRSQFFNGCQDLREHPDIGLFRRLHMKVIFAWPYHPETKPIEGFFKILGGLERQAPSYSGTSIENKPARMHRGELIHRRIYEILAANRIPTITDAHRALAEWLDRDYGVRPQKSGHLKGRCPLEVFTAGRGPGLSEEDRVKLRLLMAEMPVKRIPRDGFKMHWSDLKYYHPDLFGRQNQPGLVRYDWQDKSAIYVYDAEGNFICEARQMKKVHPAAAQLGTEEDTAELAKQLELKAHLAKSVVGPAREFIEAHVVPEVQRQIEQTCTDQEIGRKRKAQDDIAVESSNLSAEEFAAAQREFDERMAQEDPICDSETACSGSNKQSTFPDWEAFRTMSKMDRYEALLECIAREKEIDIENKRWMSMYERTDEYEKLRGYFEDTALKFQLLYGSN